MTERYINLENTYTIIPENTQESDKKRQILISKKLNGSVYNKLDIKEYQKNNFNQVFITDKINFFSLVKLLIIKKNKLYSYNLVKKIHT